MGMRLEGPKIENIVNTNIKSEGLLKGVVKFQLMVIQLLCCQIMEQLEVIQKLV